MTTRILLRLLLALLALAALPALADPPARVGRVSYLSGQVSFRTDKDEEWIAASLNYPVTMHNGFATSGNSRLELRVGSAAIRIDEDSEIALPRLDDDAIQVNVKRGVANVTLLARESRDPVEVLTPAGRVVLNGAGTYRIEAGRDADQTIVTAFQGSATLDDDGSQVTVREGRELVVSGVEPLEYSMRNARQGPFESWVFARDARVDHSRSTRYVSPEIAGYEDLDEYGNWQTTPEYGAVWVPRVTAADWAPYQHGRWAWVDPWGWTWVDAAPWGFAPFHYGRWVHYNGYWGWAPGVIARRPVYAPALVGFVGDPGWNVSFSFGSAPAVGWVPLGYYDLYRPGYRCSPTYVRNVNITNINVRNVNVTNVNWSNPPTPDYALRKYPHAVTVVPQNAFASGKPVANQVASLGNLHDMASQPVIGAAPRIAAPVRRMIAGDVAGNQPAGNQRGQQPAGRQIAQQAPLPGAAAVHTPAPVRAQAPVRSGAAGAPVQGTAPQGLNNLPGQAPGNRRPIDGRVGGAGPDSNAVKIQRLRSDGVTTPAGQIPVIPGNGRPAGQIPVVPGNSGPAGQIPVVPGNGRQAGQIPVVPNNGQPANRLPANELPGANNDGGAVRRQPHRNDSQPTSRFVQPVQPGGQRMVPERVAAPLPRIAPAMAPATPALQRQGVPAAPPATQRQGIPAARPAPANPPAGAAPGQGDNGSGTGRQRAN